MRLLILAIAGMHFGVIGAQAATFKSVATKENKTVIWIDGDIAEGDADSVTALIKAANAAGRVVSRIRLSSNGGSLIEGIKLADVIKFSRAATVVASGATCASACFIAFAAGSEKFASYGSFVGVHGASEGGQETVRAGAATVSMARAVKDLGVPPAIIGKMVVTPPDKMVWLSPDDLRSMGATLTGKPAQAKTDETSTLSQTPSAPLDISPATKASAPPKWEDLVDKIASISAQQNGGKANFSRSCQPELKICNTGVSYFDKEGSRVLAKMTEDLKGIVIRRELCTFNKFGDVRYCVDWESGRSHRDMQDSKGEWTKVADE